MQMQTEREKLKEEISILKRSLEERGKQIKELEEEKERREKEREIEREKEMEKEKQTALLLSTEVGGEEGREGGEG